MRKMTRNDLSGNIVKIGYNKMYYLLKFEYPAGYNSGRYGWNYDIFKFNNITIVTGCRNMTGVKIDIDIIKPYEDKARIISHDYSLTTEVKRAKTESLLYQCLNEIYNRYFEEV